MTADHFGAAVEQATGRRVRSYLTEIDLAEGRLDRSVLACTRRVVVSSSNHSDAARSVTVRFSGQVHGHKLTPGSLRLALTPNANGRQGRTVTLAFRIVN